MKKELEKYIQTSLEKTKKEASINLQMVFGNDYGKGVAAGKLTILSEVKELINQHG